MLIYNKNISANYLPISIIDNIPINYFDRVLIALSFQDIESNVSAHYIHYGYDFDNLLKLSENPINRL